MSEIFLWEVYCITDSAYKEVWSISEPTTCPDNNQHTISSTPPPRILNTIKSNTVKIDEEADGTTQGIYKFKGFQIDIPSGSPGNVTTSVTTLNYPITLINGWFIAHDDMCGDQINLSVADNTVIGAIASPVYSGNTEIIVTGTVIDNIYKGYYMSLTDGVNLNSLGEVIDIDYVNSKIIVENEAVNNFSPLSPTYVLMTVKVIENFSIPVTNMRYAFAEKKVGGKYLPANTPWYIKYTNNSGNAKTFCYNLEYLY